MTNTAYTSLYEITDLQQWIMRFVDYWANTVKTPIPQKEIVAEMKRRNKTYGGTISALRGLLKSGYIRKAVISTEPLNTVRYVQLRSI